MNSVTIAKQYCTDVLTGKELAGELVMLACLRFANDLTRKDLVFRDDKAQKALTFFSYLKHYKGEWAGKPFELSPSQVFIVANIFGFYKLDGTRRFKKAVVEVPRKYGKTTLAAGIALYMFIGDGEAGAEVYTGATTADQAKICFTDARHMTMSSPELSTRVQVLTRNMSIIKSKSKFEYVCSDDKTLDGLNPHCAVLDEAHAHKTSGLYDVLISAMGARQQSLLLLISTAGFKKEWWYYKVMRKGAISILKNLVLDDSTFCIIYTLDEGDDYEDPKNWKKANPGIGVTIKESYLADRINDAKVRPSELVNVLTKHFNVWTDVQNIWIPSKTWALLADKQEETALCGLKCFGGVDLSYIRDITAYTLNFRLLDGRRYFKHKFFVPLDTARDRELATGIPYKTWIDEGHLIASPGNTIDYALLKEHIIADFDKYDVHTIGFDKNNASHIMQEINAEVSPLQLYVNDRWQTINRVYGISPHIKLMNLPTKEFERSVVCDILETAHDGNPVMAWMLANVVIFKDHEGNIRPDKAKSEEKIDGVISTILSIEQELYWSQSESGSKYETADLLVL